MTHRESHRRMHSNCVSGRFLSPPNGVPGGSTFCGRHKRHETRFRLRLTRQIITQIRCAFRGFADNGATVIAFLLQ